MLGHTKEDMRFELEYIIREWHTHGRGGLRRSCLEILKVAHSNVKGTSKVVKYIQE